MNINIYCYHTALLYWSFVQVFHLQQTYFPPLFLFTFIHISMHKLQSGISYDWSTYSRKKSLYFISLYWTNCYFADSIFNVPSLMKMFEFRLKFQMNFVPWGAIKNLSALAKIMVCIEHVTSHYLNQWWPSSLTPIYAASLSLNHITHCPVWDAAVILN